MNILKFPGKFDIDPIKEEIENNPNCWRFDEMRQTIYVQRYTQSIPLRASKSRRGMLKEDVQDVVPTLLVQYYPKTMAVLDGLISTLGGECGRVAIVRLPPAKFVARHVDEGAYYRARDRFHLVIQGVYEYNVDGESEIFQSGDLFWFDSQKTHHSRNIGDEDRIVLIFDLKGSNFREAFNV